MNKVRRIPGALHGSELIEQPHVAPEVAAVRAFIAEADRALVDVGFDHGRRLHSTALGNPRWRVLGLEVRKRRVEEAIARARRDGLTNILPWRMDARTVLAGVLDSDSVDVVEVLFPTPWWHPGLRMKRLLIDGHFLGDLARVLKEDGVVHIATDVEAYARTIESDVRASSLVALDPQACAPRLPVCTQQSRRQWKCEREGTVVRRWCLGRG
jgi:tRNA (guanine-N7-)-methyltransferase